MGSETRTPRRRQRRTAFGKGLERDWPELIAEAFGLLFRLASRGIRSFFD